ncbi:hypothetical protein [Dyella sp. 2HG41-7]|uniref:hypothetical protein n=1 Tax=Dyella sp. 2HG41-7 TaxID=2883239 RepID=UPI001F38A573|nr:hypothetical protein [Dyella sp. 2HG41-7]
MSQSTFTHPSAWIPLAMSLAAFCVVAAHLIFVGTAREVDEGPAAHIFQLLMAGQIPIIAFFAIKWLRPTEKYAAMVLASQILAGAVACAPVWYFNV